MSKRVYGPIVGIERYRSSLVVKRMQVTQPPPPKTKGATIRYLSRSALNRLAFTALNTRSEFTSILTLSYCVHSTQKGRQVKKQLNAFLTTLRRLLKKLSYLWFLEFQKRGAPHFHFLLSHLPSDEDRDTVARVWAGLTTQNCDCWEKVRRVHAHTKAWEPVRSQDGAKRYALKYCLKTRQKAVPEQYQDVGRFWGASRDVSSSAKEIFWSADVSEWDVRMLLEASGREDLAQNYNVIPAVCFLPTDETAEIPIEI